MLFISLFLILVTGCGESAGEPPVSPAIPVLELYPSVSIGSGDLTGEDSFGAISDVEFTGTGDILVLDRMQGCGLVYSTSGEFLHRLGRSGSGPGEFISPDCAASFGENTVIFERSSGKASVFLPDGSYSHEMSEASGVIIPTYCCFGDTLLAGGLSARDTEGGEMAGVYMVLRFNTDLEPVDTLYTHHYTMEYGDFSSILRNTSFSCSFDCDGEGNLFVAPASSREFLLMGFDGSGSCFLELQQDVEAVAKTPEEIRIERERFNSLIRARNSGFTGSFDPLQNRYMIPPNGVHADGLGRVWIRNGLSSGHEFLVYDYSGNLLFTANANGIDELETNDFLWWTVDEEGLLCFSMDPAEYPVVYFYEMPEV